MTEKHGTRQQRLTTRFPKTSATATSLCPFRGPNTLMPHENEDLIWETWVPLGKDATYLELQIWYPNALINPGEDDRGYLFQMELDTRGDTEIDGLAAVELEVKASSRMGAITLEVAESTPV